MDLLGLVEAPEESLDAPRVADVPDPSLRDLSHDGRRGWAAVPAGKWRSRDTGAHWWQISKRETVAVSFLGTLEPDPRSS